MVKMPYLLIFVVLVFSIGLILYASPLILYVAPIIAFGILVSLVKDFARNRSKWLLHPSGLDDHVGARRN